MSRMCEICGKKPMVGNNVSHAHNRSRRRFLPNLQATSLYSDALDQTVRIRLSTNALRTVEHRGGLDAFLIKARDRDLPLDARRLKKRITKAAAARAE